jgi:hypothetical protein
MIKGDRVEAAFIRHKPMLSMLGWMLVVAFCAGMYLYDYRENRIDVDDRLSYLTGQVAFVQTILCKTNQAVCADIIAEIARSHKD